MESKKCISNLSKNIQQWALYSLHVVCNLQLSKWERASE